MVPRASSNRGHCAISDCWKVIPAVVEGDLAPLQTVEMHCERAPNGVPQTRTFLFEIDCCEATPGRIDRRIKRCGKTCVTNDSVAVVEGYLGDVPRFETVKDNGINSLVGLWCRRSATNPRSQADSSLSCLASHCLFSSYCLAMGRHKAQRQNARFQFSPAAPELSVLSPAAKM